MLETRTGPVSNPPTQTSVKEGQDIEYHPFTALEKSGPIKFAIDGTGDEYLDLYHTNLYVEAKVVCADGSPLPDDTDVAPVNLTLHSLFSQVDVSLNDRLVTSSKATYLSVLTWKHYCPMDRKLKPPNYPVNSGIKIAQVTWMQHKALTIKDFVNINSRLEAVASLI